MILVPVTYKGGVYRLDEVVDYIEDLGGYIVQRHNIANEVVLQLLMPQEDIEGLKEFSRPLAGEVQTSPLVGTEIAVVIPSLEIHHLPHSACDVAEYLRSHGSKSNILGMARGFGKRISQINDEERDLINEHDMAIYVLGNFATCIEKKFPKLRRGVTVPIILTGGPSREQLGKQTDPPVAGYVGGLGRFMHRTQTEADIHRLDLVIEEVERVISEKRKELSHDPLSVSPARIQDMIKQEIPEIEYVYSPSPIAVQLTGLRVKLAYEEYAQRIRDLVIEGDITVGDVADVLPSRMRNYILIRIRPLSETNIVV
ncbi:MAG: methanogenesis marker 7 protein [Methanocalculaceae archaeon]|jgi:putative methanogenesis marker protein 7|nr:methanogenesis marker 7 protein [Methanocalculaceae archaeon]